MDFNQFIKQFPEIKRATTSEDSKNILSFLKRNSSTQKRFSIYYDRSPDFFSLFKLSSPDFFVITYQDLDGEIQGMVSYTLIKAKEYDTIYMGDLKIKAKSDEMKKKFRIFASELFEKVKEIEEFKNVKYLHMVMLDDNTKAYNRLVTNRPVEAEFKKAMSYKMVNVIGLKWWKSLSPKSLSHTIVDGTTENMMEILSSYSKNKFSSDHPELLKYRAEKMKGMAKVLEVKDPQGRVLLKASLEDVFPIKRIQVTKLSLGVNAFLKLLPLFKGKNYSEGKPLGILYFSNISFDESLMDQDKSEILVYAMKAAFDYSQTRYHMISLSLFKSDEFLLPGLRSHFLTQVEPLAFYQLLPSWGEEIPKDKIPNFNMSYI